MKQLKDFFSKVGSQLMESFWVVFLVGILVSILDFIFLRTTDFGAGFVLMFLYFIGYLIYRMNKVNKS